MDNLNFVTGGRGGVTLDAPKGMAIVGDTLWVAEGTQGSFSIWDVRDKSAPVMLSRSGYATAGYTHQGWLTEDHGWFVFGDELELHFSAADFDARGIGVVDRELHAVADVVADVRLGTGQRRRAADAHRRRLDRPRRIRRLAGSGLFLLAACERCGERSRDGCTENDSAVHRRVPPVVPGLLWLT